MEQRRTTPIQIDTNLWMMDLMEQNRPSRSAAYVIMDENVTLIETGSSLSHDLLIDGLAQMGVKPTDLRYVIVTHVHLDHAGGAGQMMEKAKNAKLVVHPRGARHMIDPSRLWQGASSVYGDKIGELFGSVVPVPEEQILVMNHLDTLNIGERTLTFYDTPGHAKHHFSIHDPVADAVFAGDAAGIRYRKEFTGWDFEWVMPSTSPIDFDPVAVRNTMNLLREVPFKWVYHTHFGRSPKEEALADTERCAIEMGALIEQVYQPGTSMEEVVAALRNWVIADLKIRGKQAGNDIEVLDLDIILDSLGLMHYAEQKLAGK